MESAKRDVDDAVHWWWTTTGTPPRVFAPELARAVARLEVTPFAFPVAIRLARGVLRRLRLHRVPYFLLYRVYRRARLVEVAAVWHTSRGSLPRARSSR